MTHSFQLVLFKKSSRFPWVSGGFLERRIGKSGEGTDFQCAAVFVGQVVRVVRRKWVLLALLGLGGVLGHQSRRLRIDTQQVVQEYAIPPGGMELEMDGVEGCRGGGWRGGVAGWLEGWRDGGVEGVEGWRGWRDGGWRGGGWRAGAGGLEGGRGGLAGGWLERVGSLRLLGGLVGWWIGRWETIGRWLSRKACGFLLGM